MPQAESTAASGSLPSTASWNAFEYTNWFTNQAPPLGCQEVRDWANTYGLFLGRFRIVASSIHSSATCLVIFAFDLKQDTQNPKPVALKLMHNKDE